MKLEDRRVIVTGGSGFVGSHVVDALVALGNRVVVIDDPSSGSLDNLERHLGAAHTNGSRPPGTVEVVEADIGDPDAVHRWVANADLVVHMAATCPRTGSDQPDDAHEVNAGRTLNVALAAHRNDVGRLVDVSSLGASAPARQMPMAEDHPTEPTSVSVASKLAGEASSLALGRAFGLEVTVVRPPNSYGPRQPHRGPGAKVIPRFVLRTMAGARPVIFGSGLQTRDFTWVEDTARNILSAAADDALVGGTVNIRRGHEISVRHLAEKILTIFGRGGEPPVFRNARPGDVDVQLPETAEADRLIWSVPTVSIDEGLRRYVDWVVAEEIDVDRWLAEHDQRPW